MTACNKTLSRVSLPALVLLILRLVPVQHMFQLQCLPSRPIRNLVHDSQDRIRFPNDDQMTHAYRHTSRKAHPRILFGAQTISNHKCSSMNFTCDQSVQRSFCSFWLSLRAKLTKSWREDPGPSGLNFYYVAVDTTGKLTIFIPGSSIGWRPLMMAATNLM